MNASSIHQDLIVIRVGNKTSVSNDCVNLVDHLFSPATKPRFGALSGFEGLCFLFMDSVSLGIADDLTESWNFVSVEQFKI